MQEDAPAAHFQSATLASGPDNLQLLVQNSTVRCLSEDRINAYVEYLHALQGTPARQEGGGAHAHSTWLLPLVIACAGVYSPLPLTPAHCLFFAPRRHLLLHPTPWRWPHLDNILLITGTRQTMV